MKENNNNLNPKDKAIIPTKSLVKYFLGRNKIKYGKNK
jgi:hypothetical protein